jgi:uncharacterized protein (TIGR00266 family)
MKVDILHQPDSAIAKIQLAAQEELVAEAGSMVAMSGSINTSTTLRKGKGGGLMGGLKRMLAGESLFLSVFRTGSDSGEVFLAPKLLGDILPYQMKGVELVVQATGYLASTPGIDVEVGFQGFKSFFSGESIFWLRASGQGLILLSAFGGIYEVDVNGEYVVDTGHIVAFEKTLDFSIGKANNSWAGAIFGGEGLVCRFKGRGKVYCQTHNPGAFGSLVGALLPPK